MDPDVAAAGEGIAVEVAVEAVVSAVEVEAAAVESAVAEEVAVLRLRLQLRNLPGLRE